MGRGSGSCEGGRGQFPRAQLPEVRHGEMLRWSMTWRCGSKWGERSSWAPPGLANNGPKHQPALYLRDKGQELGGQGHLTSLVPAGHARGEVLEVPGVGLEYSLYFPVPHGPAAGPQLRGIKHKTETSPSSLMPKTKKNPVCLLANLRPCLTRQLGSEHVQACIACACMCPCV